MCVFFLMYAHMSCVTCVHLCVGAHLAGAWAHWRTCSSCCWTGGWSGGRGVAEVGAPSPSPSPPPRPPCGSAPPLRWPIASLLWWNQRRADNKTVGNFRISKSILEPLEPANNILALCSDLSFFPTWSCLTFHLAAISLILSHFTLLPLTIYSLCSFKYLTKTNKLFSSRTFDWKCITMLKNSSGEGSTHILYLKNSNPTK